MPIHLIFTIYICKSESFYPELVLLIYIPEKQEFKVFIYLSRRFECNNFRFFGSNIYFVFYSGAWIFSPSFRNIVYHVPIISVIVKPFSWVEHRSLRNSSKRIDKLIKLNHSMACTVMYHRMFLYTVKWNNINFISIRISICIYWSTCDKYGLIWQPYNTLTMISMYRHGLNSNLCC